MKKPLLTLLSLILSISFCTCAQAQNKIDSLEKLLQRAKDKDKSEILNLLSAEYLMDNPEKSIEYAQQALNNAIGTKDKKQEAIALLKLGDGNYYLRKISIAEEYYKNSGYLFKEMDDMANYSEILKKIGNIYFFYSRIDSAEIYYKLAIQLKTRKGIKNGLSTLHANLGLIYLNTGRLDEAFRELEEAISISRKEKDEKTESFALSNLAMAYYNKGLIEESMDYNLKALKISEKNNDLYSISTIYNNLGIIYHFLENFDKSLEYYKLALQINQKRKDLYATAIAYNNIGIIYFEKEQLDSSLYYHKKSLKIKEKQSDNQGIASSLHNVATIYQANEEFDQALSFLFQALEINQEINNYLAIIENKIAIGDIYLDLKNYVRAEKYLQESLILAEKYSFNRIYLIYNLLSELLMAKHDYKNSLKYHKLYASYKDSILIRDKEKSIENLKVAYDFQKQKQEIEILSKDKELQLEKMEKQKVFRNGLLLIIFTTLLLLILGYINYKNKIRSNKLLTDQNNEIKKKNEEIYQKSEHLKKVNQQLEKLSIVTSKTHNAIIVALPDGTIEWVNDGFVRLYGFTLHELLQEKGKTLIELSSNSDIQNIIQDILLSKKSRIYESSFISREGKQYILQSTLTPILDEKGDVSRLVTIDTDITNLKQIEQELKKLLSTKDKFFSIIAHDLKNPFNSLIGLTQLLVHGYDRLSDEKIKYFHQNLYQISKNGYELLINLLEWARSQTGKIEYNPLKINIFGLSEETITLFQAKATEKEIQLINQVQSNQFVVADLNMFKTILRNLVSNALKFTDRGGTVEISNYIQNDSLIISVRDTGIGMQSDVLEKIFNLDSHYTTKGTDEESGTGLGLILCKEFVEKHGGTIWAESKPGFGSIFSFSLPLNHIP
ncbi:MAG TPA: tetratricopeptide repeat-containing sensor histidine kinase [Bacteroidales bacterium]|nr:tetratricopeptide repeat-containing sensor histidine kinase [Bacteroidales bacterium]